VRSLWAIAGFGALLVGAFVVFSGASAADFDASFTPDGGVVAGRLDGPVARPDGPLGALGGLGPDAGGRGRSRRFWRNRNPDARYGGDGGIQAPVMARPAPPRPTPPPPPVPVAPAPPPGPAPDSWSSSAALSEFNTCRKVPPGKKVVKMNLKPDAELPDLVAWISSITCKSFVLPGGIGSGKKITIVAPSVMTREEAYASFLNALDSIGLTVEKSSGYLRIIETAKAKSSSLPVYGFDGRPTGSANAKSASDK
jgi:hypothetical protein